VNCSQWEFCLPQLKTGGNGLRKLVRSPTEAGLLTAIGKQTNPPRQTLSTTILRRLTLGFPTSREHSRANPVFVQTLFWNSVPVFQDFDRRQTRISIRWGF
jgi:hypothetical protein